MFPAKALLSCLLLALATVEASPVARDTRTTTLKFTTSFKTVGFNSLAEQDRARAQAMKQSGHLGKRDLITSFSVVNSATTYQAQVEIGNPPTEYTLLIDTGSSNTWVGANKPYTATSSSVDTGNPVSVSYGSGHFSGEEWTDTVTLAPGLTISAQSIGVAATSHGFEGTGRDGILGVGPIDLTNGTVANTGEVPTVMDNLFNQQQIVQRMLGVYYVPYSTPDSNDGELTFGGYDPLAAEGLVNFVPLTTTSPASMFWGIDQSISYGGSTILSSTAGIVDTGTTLILLATDAFQAYQAATGGTLDANTGLLKISAAQYANLKPLTFNIGLFSYDLTPNAQIWPRSLNTDIGGDSNSIYLVVSDMGSPSGSGLDFVTGYAFLERFYTIYDSDFGAVGFAETKYTKAETN